MDLAAIESLVALSDDGQLDLSSLPGTQSSGAGSSDELELSLKVKLEAYERGLLVTALERADGNRSEAARALGIGRATLHDKLKKYGLEQVGHDE